MTFERLGFDLSYTVAVGAIATGTALSSCVLASEKVLLLADQKAHVVVAAQCVSFFVQTGAQVIALLVFDSFLLFLASAAGGMLLWNWLCALYVRRHYTLYEHAVCVHEEHSLLQRDVLDLLPYKIGAVGLNATDAIIIALVLSSTLAGIVSNFTLIVNSLNGVLMQGFNGIAASIGLHNADSDMQRRSAVFYQLSSLGMWVFGAAAICLTLLLNPFVELWIGSSYLLSRTEVVALAGAFFVTGANQVPSLYRSSLGIFRRTRFVPVIATVVNLALSVGLALWIGLVGVFLGTILARGLTFSVVDPYLVSRTALSTRFRDYLGHYAHSLLGVVCLGIVLNLWWGFVYTPGVLTFIAWGGIIATTAFLGLALWLSFTSHFRQILSRIWER
ncbi:hypothetical protein [Nostocoides vanveenii]